MATLDPEFDRRLRGLLTAAESFGQPLSVTSGYRSAQDQARAINSVSRNVLGRPASFMEYARGIKGYAAPIGGSMHQKGLAADLGGGGLKWAHANAANYGLRFPPALAKTDPIHLEIDPKAMGPFQDPRDIEGVNPVAVPASKGGVVSAAVGAAPGSFRAAQELPQAVAQAPAVASYASSGASSMAMPPSNGWTPESVESSRRIAKALMGQGMDSSPVGHWTQALARVLQTGVGTAWDSQANVAEREGKKQVADYMSANAGASPQQFAAGLVANPFSRDFGQKMILQNMQRAPELEMQRERLKIDQQNAARQSALTAAQLQQIKMQTPEWRMANAAKFGIDPNTPEGRAFVITGNYAPKETTFNLAEGQTRYRQETQPDGTVRAVPIASSAPKIDSTARKAIYEAQDELPNIQSSIETLNEAKALLTGVGSGGAKIPPIYTGWGAQTRSNINQGAPGFLPNIITDPDRAKSTQRYNQIMTSEAIAAMAQSLKGATTNEEMARFISIMNDPSAGPEVKARTIDQMLRSAQRHMQNKQDRIKELGGRMPNLGVGEQQPVRVNSPEEARQLPKGTPILLPDGTIGRVP